MTATVRALLLAIAFVLAGCGQVEIDDELPSAPSVPTVPTSRPASRPAPTVSTVAPPPTTAAPVTAAGRTCLAIFTDGIALAREHSQEQKGIAGADEAKYRARAQVLADEARSEGCEVPPLVQQFLD